MSNFKSFDNHKTFHSFYYPIKDYKLSDAVKLISFTNHLPMMTVMSDLMDEVFRVNWRLRNPLVYDIKEVVDEKTLLASYMKKMVYLTNFLNFDMVYNESMLRTTGIRPLHDSNITDPFDTKELYPASAKSLVIINESWFSNTIALLKDVEAQSNDIMNVDITSNLTGMMNVKAIRDSLNIWTDMLNSLEINDTDIFSNYAKEFYKNTKDIIQDKSFEKELYASILVENLKALYDQTEVKHLGVFQSQDGFISLVKTMDILWSKTNLGGVNNCMFRHITKFNNLHQLLYINHHLFDVYAKIPNYVFNTYLTFTKTPIFQYIRASIVLMTESEVDCIYDMIERIMKIEFKKSTKHTPQPDNEYVTQIFIKLIGFRSIRTADSKIQISNENQHKTTVILLFLEFHQLRTFYTDGLGAIYATQNKEERDKYSKLDTGHKYDSSIIEAFNRIIKLMLKLIAEKKITLFKDVYFNDNPSLPFYVNFYLKKVNDCDEKDRSRLLSEFNKSLSNYEHKMIKGNIKAPIIPYNDKHNHYYDIQSGRYSTLTSDLRQLGIILKTGINELKKGNLQVNKYARPLDPSKLLEMETTLFALKSSKLKGPLIVKKTKGIGIMNSPLTNQIWADEYETTTLSDYKDQVKFVGKKVKLLARKMGIQIKDVPNDEYVRSNFFKDVSNYFIKLVDGSKESFSLLAFQLMEKSLIDNIGDINAYDNTKKSFPTNMVYEKLTYIFSVMAAMLNRVKELTYTILKEFNMTTKTSKLFVGSQMDKIPNEEQLVYFALSELYQWSQNARLRVDKESKKYFRLENYATQFSEYPFPKITVRETTMIPLQASSNETYDNTFYNTNPQKEDSFKVMFVPEVEIAKSKRAKGISSHIHSNIGTKHDSETSDDTATELVTRYIVKSNVNGTTDNNEFDFDGNTYHYNDRIKNLTENTDCNVLYQYLDHKVNENKSRSNTRSKIGINMGSKEKKSLNDLIHNTYSEKMDEATDSPTYENFKYLLPRFATEGLSDIVLVIKDKDTYNKYKEDEFVRVAYQWIDQKKNDEDKVVLFEDNTIFLLYDDFKFYHLPTKVKSKNRNNNTGINVQNKEIKKIHDKLDKIIRKLRALKSNKGRELEKKAHVIKEAAEAPQNINELNKKIEELQNEIKTITANKESIKDVLGKAVIKNSTTNSELTQLKLDLSKYKDEAIKLHNDYVTKTNLEIETLTEKIKSSHIDTQKDDNSLNVINELKEKLHESKELASSQDTATKIANKKIYDLEKQLTNLKEANSSKYIPDETKLVNGSKIADLNIELVQSFKIAKEGYTKQIADWQHKYEEFEKVSNDTMINLKNANQKKDDENYQLKKQILDINSKITENEQKLNASANTLVDIKINASETDKEKIKSLEEDNGRLHQEMLDLKNKVNDNPDETKLKLIDETAETHHIEIENNRNEILKLKTQLVERNTQIGNLEKTNTENSEKITTLKKTLEKFEKENTTNINTKELENLRKDLDECTKGTLTKQSIDNKPLDEMMALKLSTENQKQSITKLEKDLLELRAANVEKDKKLTAQLEEINRYKDELLTSKQELQKTKEECGTNKTESEEIIRKLKSNISELTQKHKNETETYNKEKEQFKTEINRLTELHKDCGDKLSDEMIKVKGHIQTIKDNETKLTELKKLLETAQKDVPQATKQELKSLQESIDTATKTITTLKESIKSNETTINELTTKNKNLTQELQSCTNNSKTGIGMIQEELKEQTDIMNRFSTANEEITKQLETSTGKIIQLESDKKNLTQTNVTITQENIRIKEESFNKINSCDNTNKTLRSQIEQLNLKQTQNETEYNKKLAEARQANIELQRTMANVILERNKLNLEKGYLTTQSQLYIQQFQELTNQINSLSKQKKEVDEQILQLKEQHERESNARNDEIVNLKNLSSQPSKQAPITNYGPIVFLDPQNPLTYPLPKSGKFDGCLLIISVIGSAVRHLPITDIIKKTTSRIVLVVKNSLFEFDVQDYSINKTRNLEIHYSDMTNENVEEMGVLLITTSYDAEYNTQDICDYLFKEYQLVPDVKVPAIVINSSTPHNTMIWEGTKYDFPLKNLKNFVITNIGVGAWVSEGSIDGKSATLLGFPITQIPDKKYVEFDVKNNLMFGSFSNITNKYTICVYQGKYTQIPEHELYTNILMSKATIKTENPYYMYKFESPQNIYRLKIRSDKMTFKYTLTGNLITKYIKSYIIPKRGDFGEFSYRTIDRSVIIRCFDSSILFFTFETISILDKYLLELGESKEEDIKYNPYQIIKEMSNKESLIYFINKLNRNEDMIKRVPLDTKEKKQYVNSRLMSLTDLESMESDIEDLRLENVLVNNEIDEKTETLKNSRVAIQDTQSKLKSNNQYDKLNDCITTLMTNMSKLEDTSYETKMKSLSQLVLNKVKTITQKELDKLSTYNALKDDERINALKLVTIDTTAPGDMTHDYKTIYTKLLEGINEEIKDELQSAVSIDATAMKTKVDTLKIKLDTKIRGALLEQAQILTDKLQDEVERETGILEANLLKKLEGQNKQSQTFKSMSRMLMDESKDNLAIQLLKIVKNSTSSTTPNINTSTLVIQKDINNTIDPINPISASISATKCNMICYNNRYYLLIDSDFIEILASDDDIRSLAYKWHSRFNCSIFKMNRRSHIVYFSTKNQNLIMDDKINQFTFNSNRIFNVESTTNINESYFCIEYQDTSTLFWHRTTPLIKEVSKLDITEPKVEIRSEVYDISTKTFKQISDICTLRVVDNRLILKGSGTQYNLPNMRINSDTNFIELVDGFMIMQNNTSPTYTIIQKNALITKYDISNIVIRPKEFNQDIISSYDNSMVTPYTYWMTDTSITFKNLVTDVQNEYARNSIEINDQNKGYMTVNVNKSTILNLRYTRNLHTFIGHYNSKRPYTNFRDQSSLKPVEISKYFNASISLYDGGTFVVTLTGTYYINNGTIYISIEISDNTKINLTWIQYTLQCILNLCRGDSNYTLITFPATNTIGGHKYTNIYIDRKGTDLFDQILDKISSGISFYISDKWDVSGILYRGNIKTETELHTITYGPNRSKTFKIKVADAEISYDQSTLIIIKSNGFFVTITRNGTPYFDELLTDMGLNEDTDIEDEF